MMKMGWLNVGRSKRDFSAAWADTFAGAKVGKKPRPTSVEMTGWWRTGWMTTWWIRTGWDDNVVDERVDEREVADEIGASRFPDE